MLKVHNHIILFGVDRLLIELNKFLIFFHVTNFSMMFWLIKYVTTYFCNITFFIPKKQNRYPAI